MRRWSVEKFKVVLAEWIYSCFFFFNNLTQKLCSFDNKYNPENNNEIPLQEYILGCVRKSRYFGLKDTF